MTSGNGRSATDLVALVDGKAADLADVTREPASGCIEFGRKGRLFAVVSDVALDVALDPVVAAAALRTPEVQPGARGRGWVTFAPSGLDRFAIDRALAWFEAGWRRAGDPPPS